MDCNLGTCEAHLYMSETMKELRNITSELSKNQQRLDNSMIKLIENFSEMQRINQRLETIVVSQHQKDSEQDRKLDEQRAYMNKSLGILGALTFLVPVVISILAIVYK